MATPVQPKQAARDTKQSRSAVADAVETLSKMASAGSRPDRMENEIARIVDAWDASMEPAELDEKLEELRENMTAAVAGFQQDMQDNGVKALNKTDQRVLAALQACQQALERQKLRQAA